VRKIPYLMPRVRVAMTNDHTVHDEEKMMRVHRAIILSPLLFVLGCAVPGDDAQESSLETAGSLSDGSLPSDNATIPFTNCTPGDIIPVWSFNGTQGAAVRECGWTYVPNYANQEHEFLIGTDFAIYHSWTNANGGSGWERDAGVATSGVWAGIINGGTTLQLCVIGNDHSTVYSKEYSRSTGWGPWTNVGKSFAQCTRTYMPQAL
jgi:hypothetical protein